MDLSKVLETLNAYQEAQNQCDWADANLVRLREQLALAEGEAERRRTELLAAQGVLIAALQGAGFVLSSALRPAETAEGPTEAAVPAGTGVGKGAQVGPAAEGAEETPLAETPRPMFSLGRAALLAVGRLLARGGVVSLGCVQGLRLDGFGLSPTERHQVLGCALSMHIARGRAVDCEGGYRALPAMADWSG